MGFLKFEYTREIYYLQKQSTILDLEFKRVFTWDFISGEMKYFNFGVYSQFLIECVN